MGVPSPFPTFKKLVTPGPKLPPPRSLPEAARRGAKNGFRWTTYVAGPVAVMMLLIGLGILGVMIEVGQKVGGLADEKTRAMLLGPFGFYIVSCLWGVVIGGAVGAVLYLVRRTRAGTAPITGAEISGIGIASESSPGPGESARGPAGTAITEAPFMEPQVETRPRCEHCQSENLVPLQVEPGSHTESGAIVTSQAPEGIERQYRCADCHRITVVNNRH